MPAQLPPGMTLEHFEIADNPAWLINDARGNKVAEISLVENTEGVWSVAYTESKVRGLGAYLNNVARQWCASRGEHIASDDFVSDSAAKIWDKNFQRDDVKKVPHPRKVFRNEPGREEEERTEPSLQYKYSQYSMAIDNGGHELTIRRDNLQFGDRAKFRDACVVETDSGEVHIDKDAQADILEIGVGDPSVLVRVRGTEIDGDDIHIGLYDVRIPLDKVCAILSESDPRVG